jgi:hypothetical protein
MPFETNKTMNTEFFRSAPQILLASPEELLEDNV